MNDEDSNNIVSDAQDKMQQIPDAVEGATDQVSQYLEDGLNKVEETIDGFGNALDNFLNKF